MILASRIGLEESKLIPHTSFDTLFHIRCQNKSITGLEDIIGQVQLSASMLDFLENIFKKTFFLSLILGPPPPMMEVPLPSSPATPQQSSGSLAWERATDRPVDMGPGVAD